MNVERVHHVAVICSDYSVSKAFYIETLGFEPIREVYRQERGSYRLDLKVTPTFQIELFSFPNPPKRPSYPEACGARHIAFEVADIEATIQELKAKNVKAEEIRIDPETGRKFSFFFDPDQLPLELYEKMTEISSDE